MNHLVSQSTTNNIHIDFNSCYQPVLHTGKRFNVLYGGAASGKSHYISAHVILDCLNNKNRKWACVRKVAHWLRVSVFEELITRISEYNLTKYFTVNKSDMTITCERTKSKIILLGIDDPEKLKSISGINKFWIEEASELTIDDFYQIDLRLRASEDDQIFLTFNPISSSHWLKEYFFDKPNSDTFILKTTYLDNKYVPKIVKQRLEAYKLTNEYYYNVYALAEWGNLSGQIYTNYDVVTTTPDNFDERFYGLDFGFNNPTALVEVMIKDNEYYIKELLYQPELTNTELIQKIKQLNIKGAIYADAAEPARIAEINAELHSAGVSARAADKSVRDGIDFVKSQKIHLTASSSNLIKEINGYQWKKDKSGKSLDEPTKVNDHLIDAMRYAIYTHCKNNIQVPVIRMSGITYPDNKKHQTPADAIQAMKQQFRFRNQFR